MAAWETLFVCACLSVRGLSVYCETRQPALRKKDQFVGGRHIHTHLGTQGKYEKMWDGKKCSNKYLLPVKMQKDR